MLPDGNCGRGKKDSPGKGKGIFKGSRAFRQRESISGTAVRRTEAASSDRQGAGNEPDDPAV